MSTSDKNLSELNYDFPPAASELKIAIIRSEWNADITTRLLHGAMASLEKIGISGKQIVTADVPGSFELPMGAQMFIEAADPKPNAVICLGCIIRGETSHFEFISQTVARGIKDVGLKYNLPVIFGVLTDDNKEQSMERSGGSLGNKGEEAAFTAVRMALLQRQLRK